MSVLRQITSCFMAQIPIIASTHRNRVFRFVGPSTPRWNLILVLFLFDSGHCCFGHSCVIKFLITSSNVPFFLCKA